MKHYDSNVFKQFEYWHMNVPQIQVACIYVPKGEYEDHYKANHHSAVKQTVREGCLLKHSDQWWHNRFRLFKCWCTDRRISVNPINTNSSGLVLLMQWSLVYCQGATIINGGTFALSSLFYKLLLLFSHFQSWKINLLPLSIALSNPITITRPVRKFFGGGRHTGLWRVVITCSDSLFTSVMTFSNDFFFHHEKENTPSVLSVSNFFNYWHY